MTKKLKDIWIPYGTSAGTSAGYTERASQFQTWITGGFTQQFGPQTSGYSAPVEDDYLDTLIKPKKEPACRHPKLPKDSCFEKLPCPDCQKLVKI